MTNYQIALLSGGSLGERGVLTEASIREMLTPQLTITDRKGGDQGLVWWSHELPNGEQVWRHTGGDPGINTLFDFQPSSGRGVIVFANTWGANLGEVGERLFEEMRHM